MYGKGQARMGRYPECSKEQGQVKSGHNMTEEPLPGPDQKKNGMTRLSPERPETGDARPDEDTRNGLISREILLAGCHMAHSVDTIDTSNWV